MNIRAEQPSDRISIHALLGSAFPDEPVAQLVDDLRTTGNLWCSLVAEMDGVLVGQIGFSPVVIEPCASSVAQLAPLAVASNCQRQGIGAMLVHAGIDYCRLHGIDAVLVLGAPHYYERFGFDLAIATHLRSRWSGPHLMALELVPGVFRDCADFTLPAAFDILS